MKIDHIAIAVNDVEESAKVYQQALGVDSVEFEIIEFLDKKGQGLHHMALETDNIEGEVGRMEECGIQFLGKIRPGSAGTKVTFIHPKSLHGVLAELCSHPN
jgi:methylmalonyl-CoA/ethylmalonyl-CoA epimerase